MHIQTFLTFYLFIQWKTFIFVVVTIESFWLALQVTNFLSNFKLVLIANDYKGNQSIKCCLICFVLT
jgi:hypothetical protein